MAIDCKAIGTLPEVGTPLNLRVMGLMVRSMPSASKPTFSDLDAINSLLQQAQVAMGPMQAIFDLVGAATSMIKVMEAIPNSITEADPSIMVDALEEAIAVVDKLAPYIPQYSLVPFMLDMVKMISAGLSAVRAILVQLQTQITRVADARADAEATGNDCLLDLVGQLEDENVKALEHGKATFAGVAAPLTVLTTLLESLPAPPGLPEIPDVTDLPLEEVIEVIDAITAALDVISP